MKLPFQWVGIGGACCQLGGIPVEDLVETESTFLQVLGW